MSTPALDAIRAALPEPARDLRLNLQAVLAEGALTDAQRWGVAVAAAIASRHPELRDAVLGGAARIVEASVIDDARAAAASWP